MVNSPISIPLAPSLSRNPSDLLKTQALAADALKIERYINARMDKDFTREFDFAAIALDLSLDLARVHGLLSKFAGHENVITVCNPQNRPRTSVAGRTTNGSNRRSDVAIAAAIEPSAVVAEATA